MRKISRASSPSSRMSGGMSRSYSRGSLNSDDESVESLPEYRPNRRIEIMMKKELDRQNEEAQFTYQPTMFTQRSPSSQKMRREKEIEGDQENRFDKLYVDAIKRQITEKIIQQITNDVTHDHDLTFKPRLSKKGANLSRSASRERLGISRSSFSSEASSVRSRSSSPACSEHSFTPQITKKAKLSAVRRSLSTERFFSDEPLSSRLYRQAAVLQEKAALKKEEFDQLAMQECTFTPQLATSRFHRGNDYDSVGSGTLDVTERLLQKEKMRKLKLEQSKLEADAKQREELTFKPNVKPYKNRSESPVKPKDLIERLLTPGIKKRNDYIAEANATAELTFKPKLTSKRTLSPNTVARDKAYESVHEKLFVEGVHRLRERDTEAERQRAELSSEHTFHPRLRSRSGTPQQTNNNDDNSSVGSRSANNSILFERLAYQDKINPHRQEKVEKEYTKDLTFKPTISEKSREIQSLRNSNSNNTPIYERLKEKADKSAAEVAAKRELLAQQRLEKEEKSLRNPQLSRRSLEIVAQQRRSWSPHSSPNKHRTCPNSADLTIGYETGEAEVDNDSLANSGCESVFSRLSSQHTTSSHRRRSLVAREHLLGRDDPHCMRLSMDESDVWNKESEEENDNNFVRASAKRTLSGRDLQQMVERLSVPYPRENRPADSFIEPEHHNVQMSPNTVPSLVLPEAVIGAAVHRLTQKTTRAFIMATNDDLRLKEQEKIISDTVQYTPKKMSESQRASFFHRLASGEKRTDVGNRATSQPRPQLTRSQIPQSKQLSQTTTSRSRASSVSSVNSSRNQQQRSNLDDSDNASVSTIGSVHSVRSDTSIRSSTSTSSKQAASTPAKRSSSASSSAKNNAINATVSSFSRKVVQGEGEVKTSKSSQLQANKVTSRVNSRSNTPTNSRSSNITSTGMNTNGRNSRSSTPQRVQVPTINAIVTSVKSNDPAAAKVPVCLRGRSSSSTTSATTVANRKLIEEKSWENHNIPPSENNDKLETQQDTIETQVTITVESPPKTPTRNVSAPAATSVTTSLLSCKASAERMTATTTVHSPLPLSRKPSNSRIPMPVYQWAGSKQNTGTRPSDDFEAKLQASLAMLKPLDDLLASPLMSPSRKQVTINDSQPNQD